MGNVDMIVLYNSTEGTVNMNITKQEHITDIINMGKIEEGTIASLQNTRLPNIDKLTLS